MGLTALLEEFNAIFRNPENFDITGLAKAGVVSPELIDQICSLSLKDEQHFTRVGYSFHWFDPNKNEGLIAKWIKTPPIRVSRGCGKTTYSLRIYVNRKGANSYAEGSGRSDPSGTGDGSATEADR